MHPKKYIRKDLKEMLCEQFGDSEFIIILRRAVSMQVIPTMLANTMFYCEIGDALYVVFSRPWIVPTKRT